MMVYAGDWGDRAAALEREFYERERDAWRARAEAAEREAELAHTRGLRQQELKEAQQARVELLTETLRECLGVLRSRAVTVSNTHVGWHCIACWEFSEVVAWDEIRHTEECPLGKAKTLVADRESGAADYYTGLPVEGPPKTADQGAQPEPGGPTVAGSSPAPGTAERAKGGE